MHNKFGGICVYDPSSDAKGNSILGVEILKTFVEKPYLIRPTLLEPNLYKE